MTDFIEPIWRQEVLNEVAEIEAIFQHIHDLCINVANYPHYSDEFNSGNKDFDRCMELNHMRCILIDTWKRLEDENVLFRKYRDLEVRQAMGQDIDVIECVVNIEKNIKD